MKKKTILLGMIFILILALTLESKAAQKEQPKMGGTLLFGLGKEFGNPHPFVANDVFQFAKSTIYESLLDRDDDDHIIPSLATTYEVSSGGTVRTLRLRKGVKFHNGKEMKDDYLPERFTKKPIPDGFAKGQTVNLEPMISEYYEHRGWDNDTGIPTRKKLEGLGLEEAAPTIFFDPMIWRYVSLFEYILFGQ